MSSLDSPLEGDGFEPPVSCQIGSDFKASLSLLEGGVPARFPPTAYALLQAWPNRAPQVSAPDRVAARYLRPTSRFGAESRPAQNRRVELSVRASGC